MTVLHHQRFVIPDDNPLPQEYDIVWSDRAGFAYADTPADQRVYDCYYAQFSKYEAGDVTTGGGDTPGDAARLAQTADDVARTVEDRKASIIDVGCANGGLLVALRRLGFAAVAGIDPSPACVQTVQAKHGISAEVGGLMNLPAQTRKANVVLLCHVLEHVRDLGRGVEALASLLAEDGIAYVEVPDAGRYREFVFAPFQDFNTEHINHFGAASLVNLMRRGGFEPISCATKTIETAPGLPYPALFGFFRKRGVAASAADFLTDSDLLASLEEYVGRSSEILARIESVIGPLVRSRMPLVVWGTGQLTMKLLAETSLFDANLVALVDGNPINHGKTLCGRAICPPERIPIIAPDACILIGTLLHHEAIVRRIRGDLGLKNQIVTLSAPWP